MKRGWVSSSSSLLITGLNRSTWPTCRMRPASCARSTSFRASPVVSVIGFSTSRCLPAFRSCSAIGKCVGVGVAMVAASMASANSSSDGHGPRPMFFGDLARRVRVGIEDGGEFAVRQFRQDARVIFSDVAEAGDADA